MSFAAIVVLAWLIHGMVKRFSGRPADTRPEKPGNHKLRYKFDARQNWALALAHPIASARAIGAYADPKARGLSPQQAQALRASLLHILGLRASAQDDAIRSALPELLRQHWYRIDLDRLRPDDDARAALAFASARVAFAVRAATLLGWLDPALQWEVLYQNAQRARDCFGSWQEFGAALARGRQQWIVGARADSLGAAFDEARLAQWLGSRGHPWRSMPWHGPVLFAPPAA
ncbi:DUF1266 domain-containing protein [Massilia atriviolacea]|uniref:DUF1266 domain-containing protein n=1 Tax=Massilia atriviolacea TaxID=2495579 RepID=A0A430HI49_9BURK|nr:DUF1266 domain-containing protein [Massilia atriviolacea]RSZ57179.1 DUF1266 domain-containing protein [Massilia atriviolacea]